MRALARAVLAESRFELLGAHGHCAAAHACRDALVD